MTRRRWIADQVSGERAILLGRNAEHLARSLRVRVGQEFEVSTGESVRLGRVVHVADDRVEFELGDRVPQEEVTRLTLLLAVFKFDRMEWAIEKATELGVAAILPVLARRTETHLASAAAKRVERWRRIVHEAAQQSRRIAPPEVVTPQPLKGALTLPADLRIMLAETEAGLSLRQAFAQDSLSKASSTTGGGPLTVALAVGPEGGWAPDELAAFKAAGWTSASLGRTILRAETAAIVALAIALSEINDR
ncbi:MAG: RsmE family RNA methyltransferase [Terriglobales bacterium]